MIESLVSYHPVAGDWGNLMNYNNIVGSIHLDKTLGKCSQTQLPSIKVLMRNEDHPSVEYECIPRSIRLVRAENERVYAATHSTTTSVPRIINTKGDEGSVKVASVTSSVVGEVNNRMNMFKSLLFTT